jgi:hypothetical protein
MQGQEKPGLGSPCRLQRGMEIWSEIVCTADTERWRNDGQSFPSATRGDAEGYTTVDRS